MLKKRFLISVMLFVFVVMASGFFNTISGVTGDLKEKDTEVIKNLDYQEEVYSNKLYHPCLNLGKNFQFDISINNPENHSAVVHLRIYDKDGNLLNPGPFVIEVFPFETKIIPQRDIPGGAASLEIESSTPISSDAYFYSPADGKRSVLSAAAGLSKQLDFPMLFEGDIFSKELTLFNVQSLPAELKMIIFDKDGEKLAAIDLGNLKSKSSTKLSPLEILSNDILQKLSTIRIESSLEIIGIQMTVNCLDQTLYCFPALYEKGSNWISIVPEGIEFLDPSSFCGIFNPGQTRALISVEALDKTLNSAGTIRTLNLAPHSLYFFRTDDEDEMLKSAYALKLRSDSPIKAFRVPLITDSYSPAYEVITDEKNQASTSTKTFVETNVIDNDSLSSIQSAVINCEFCQRIIPSEGFDNPVMGAWNGYSDWYIYCTFNDDYCGGGAYCDHTGEDWNLRGGANVDLGAPVYAVSNGKVVDVRYNTSFGNQILIQHSDTLNTSDQNVWSQYSHLKSLPVLKIGDSVYRGQQIGNIGSTGTGSTSSHLHFETRVRNYSISGWPASGYRSNCPKALELLTNAGYRSPTNILNSRRYYNRTDRITPLMQQYRNLGIINATLNRYYVEKRDSFIAILIRALEIRAGKRLTEAADPYFTDLPQDAGLRSPILKALQLGIINKSADRKFYPAKPISRIEAVTFVVKTYEKYLGIINYTNASYFSDIQVVPTSDSQWWIYNYAQKGYAGGLVTGYVDGTNRWLCPLKFTVREEAVAFVNNLINKLINSVPVISSFAINNGAGTTNNRVVILNNSSSGNPTHYRASQNSSFSDAAWQIYSSTPSFTLSTGDGLKIVYLQVKNSYGSSTIKSDTITLKTSDAAPYCQNVVLPSSVTIPNRIYFSGYANDDKGLKTIAMYVSGPKGNDLLAFSTSVSGTSLNLSSYYFDSNNSYYAGVAGTYTIKLMIQDTASQVTYCIFYVVVNSSVDQKPYFQNPYLPSSVTIPNRIYFSGYAYDDKGLKTITMMVSGPRGNNLTAFSTSISGTSLNLSSYYFDSNNTNYAGMAGNYTVALWIKDTADQTASVVFSVVVNSSADQKPYFQNPYLPSSVTIPNRIYFSGYAYDDKGLKTITMMVSGPKGNNLTAFSSAVSGTSLNLSSYYFDSNNTNYAGMAGNYTVALWIKDTADQTASVVFSVQVNAPTPSYSVSSSSTTNGGGTWGSILRLNASLSGTNLTLTVRKSDGSAWTSPGTVYFKVGTYEPYGVNRVQYSAYAGATSFSYTHNLLDYQGQYPKSFYVRYEASGGGYAWVGPITVTEN